MRTGESNRHLLALFEGGDVAEGNLMETLCGVQEDVMIKSENSRTVVRLVTDDMYTDEGFKLSVRSGRSMQKFPLGCENMT